MALPFAAVDPGSAPLRSRGAEGNGFGPRPGFVPFALAEAETTLVEKFQRVATTHPDSTAVVDESGAALSYGELLQHINILAGRLAARLFSEHAQPIVMIAVSPGLPAVELILASLFAGCAYFPVDLSWPDTHIAGFCRASNPDIIVVADEQSSSRFQRFAPESAGRIFHVGEPEGSIQTITHIAGLRHCSPENTAAVFATSGSTGDPKLVTLSHRAVLFDIGRQVNDLYLGPDDRFDLLFSLGFSASLAPLFAALLVGAQLHLCAPGAGLVELPDWLEQRKISISTMSVSTLRTVFLGASRVWPPGNLRLVSVGGEALLASDVRAYRRCFPPGCILQNAMAATETRTYAQFFIPPFGEVADPVGIGWPVYKKEVVLLDEQGEPAAKGAIGEIAVRSAYLSSGYLNDKGLTDRKFRRCEDGSSIYRTGDLGGWQPDGSLAYRGRADLLVKIRGYRVELAAVETAILRFGVVGCAVASREDVPGDPRLIAYVVAERERPIQMDELRALLAKELPDYMVPSQFVSLDALPTNSNGKLDRKNLPAPPQAFPADEISDENNIEAELRNIWTQVLGVSGFSREASFIELGGDSLKAVRVQLTMRERFGKLGALYFHRHASLVDVLAAMEQKKLALTGTDSLVSFVKEGSHPPIVFIPGFYGNFEKGREIAVYAGGDRPVHAVDVLNQGAQDSVVPVEAIAAENLRQIQTTMRGNSRLILIGFSFGAMIAFEMARQLIAAGGPMPLLFIGDMPAVNSPRWRRRNLGRTAVSAALNLPQWTRRAASSPDSKRFLRNSATRIGLRFRRVVSRSSPRAEYWAQLDPSLLQTGIELPESFLKALRNNTAALARYVPQSYSGDVVLLRARAGSLFADREPTMGWKSLVDGKIAVEWVPGEHSTCFDDPNLAGTMAIIQRHIDRFEHTSESSRDAQVRIAPGELHDSVSACIW